MQIFYFTLILCFGISTSQAQTKLGKAKKSLSSKSSAQETIATSSNYSSSGYYNYDDNDDDSDYGFLTELLLNITWPFIEAAATVPYYVAIQSPWEKEHAGVSATMLPYAFEQGYRGLYTYEKTENTSKFTATLSDRFVYENRNIQGNHLNLNLRFWQRAGLEIDHLLLWENNPNFGKDQLSMLNALAKYYRVRTERFVGWWGLGANYVGSSINKVGFAYGLGLEAFIAKPVSLEATFNGSWVNQEHISKFNAGLNYHIKNIKLSGGYEYLQLGEVKFSLFSVGAGISF